jgi:putative phosphoesterase
MLKNLHEMSGVKRVGVISDTHGLMRPEALAVFDGVDLILHAGDVGAPEVLDRLRAVAPVAAIRGNVDRASWARDLPATDMIEVGGKTVYLVHDLNDLDLDPAAAGISAVISGHSHRPAIRWGREVLYLNPGSAGPRRFRLPITIALLDMGDGAPAARLVHLA